MLQLQEEGHDFITRSMLMYWIDLFLIVSTQVKKQSLIKCCRQQGNLTLVCGHNLDPWRCQDSRSEHSDAESLLYGDGCEDGWMSYGHYCYFFQVREANFSTALMACEALGGDLASVWSAQERKFITDVLWQPNVSPMDFAWFGLHGTQDNTWAYLDQSMVIMTEGVLSSSSGVPADKKNRCGAFMGTGSLAFLDCQGMTAQGYVCKKALRRVFATSPLLNHTIPTSNAPVRAAQLYERVWPPTLLAFPPVTHYLATDDTDSETGCAYRCFNVRGCMAFQVTCITSDMCKSLTCTLLKQL